MSTPKVRFASDSPGSANRATMFILNGILVFCLVFATATCGSEKSTQIDDPPAGFKAGHYYPAWNPEGTHVAFIHSDVDEFQRPITLLKSVNVQTREIVTLHDLTGLGLRDLSWSPDGSRLAFSGSSGIYVYEFDKDSSYLLTQGSFLVSPTWSRTSGRLIFAINSGPEVGILSIALDGTGLRRWSDPALSLTRPSAFSDSDSLVVSQFAPGGFCVAVFYPGDTSLSLQMTCNLMGAENFRISPDSRHIYFLGNTSGPSSLGIYSLNRESSVLEMVYDGSGLDLSPDGETLVISDLNRSRGLILLNVLSGESKALTEPGE